jgi:Fe-S cluster biogenesis protein NfuA
MKKDQDEVNAIRQKYNALLKKDTGNLTVRDFTDDIYNST